MGEKQCLVKAGPGIGDADRQGGAGKRGKPFVRECERYKGRAGFGDAMAKAGGDVIGEARGAHGRDRSAPRGEDEIAGCDRVADAVAVERGGELGAVMREVGEAGGEPEGGTRVSHFGTQHIDDLNGFAVAEELAQGFFMIRDVVARDQIDKIPLGISGERRTGEMRIGRQEIVRAAMQVGEIAAPAAGDADFLARFFGLINDQRVRPRMGRAHHAGGTGTEDESVDLHVLPLGLSRVQGQALRGIGLDWKLVVRVYFGATEFRDMIVFVQILQSELTMSDAPYIIQSSSRPDAEEDPVVKTPGDQPDILGTEETVFCIDPDIREVIRNTGEQPAGPAAAGALFNPVLPGFGLAGLPQGTNLVGGGISALVPEDPVSDEDQKAAELIQLKLQGRRIMLGGFALEGLERGGGLVLGEAFEPFAPAIDVLQVAVGGAAFAQSLQKDGLGIDAALAGSQFASAVIAAAGHAVPALKPYMEIAGGISFGLKAARDVRKAYRLDFIRGGV